MPTTYWERSDQFDMALDLTAGRRGLAALGTVITRWVTHLLAVEVAVEPLIEAQNVNLTWYVGLDAQGTAIGDALWNGEALEDGVARPDRRALSADAVPIRTSRWTRPGTNPSICLLAMTADGMVRMKPQNLLTGLPIRQLETVS